MSVTELQHQVVEYRAKDLDAHVRRVGEWLQAERAANDRRFTDVQLVSNGQYEFLHSAVAVTHSLYLRKLLSSQRPPISVDLSPCNVQSMSKVVEWMYFGRVGLQKLTIAEDLEVTARLGVECLHRLLEGTFYQMASSLEYRIPCLNVAMNERYNISASIRRHLLTEIARVHGSLSTAELRALTPLTVQALMANQDVTVKEKIGLLKLVVQWGGLNEQTRELTTAASTALSALLNCGVPAEQPSISNLSTARSLRSESQQLVNPRLFSVEDVVDFQQLPSTRELFPPRSGDSRGLDQFDARLKDTSSSTPLSFSEEPRLPPLPPIKHNFPRANSPSQIPSVAYMVGFQNRDHEFERPSSSASLRSDAYVVGKHAFKRPQSPASLSSDAYEVSGASQREISEKEAVGPIDRFRRPKSPGTIPSEAYAVRPSLPTCGVSKSRVLSSNQHSEMTINDVRDLPNPFVPASTFSHPQLSRSDIEALQQLPDVFAKNSNSGNAKTGAKSSLNTAVERSTRSPHPKSSNSSNLKTARSIRSTYLSPHAKAQQSVYAYEKNDQKRQ